MSIIPILNLIVFASYPFAAVATYFFFILFVILNALEDRFTSDKSKFLATVVFPGIWVFALFLNFWVNNELTI